MKTEINLRTKNISVADVHFVAAAAADDDDDDDIWSALAAVATHAGSLADVNNPSSDGICVLEAFAGPP